MPYLACMPWTKPWLSAVSRSLYQPKLVTMPSVVDGSMLVSSLPRPNTVEPSGIFGFMPAASHWR